jgi:peptide/histidine transporter 3/4
MKSLAAALNLATSAAGSWLVALLIPFLSRWLPDDLNHGHADYFFLLLAAMMAVNLVVFVVYARSYSYCKSE